MTDQPKTFRISKDETYAVLAIVIFVISLVLPAGKHGKVLTGIECLVVGTIMPFIGSKAELAFKSILALTLNLSMVVSILTIFNSGKNRRLRITVASLIMLIALLLAFSPYSGFEQMFIGYYAWLFSAFWLAIVLLRPVVRMET